MDPAPEKSVDSLTHNETNQEDEITDNSETEKPGTTHEVCVGDKIEVYWPLDDNYHPGSVSEYSETLANIALIRMTVRLRT